MRSANLQNGPGQLFSQLIDGALVAQFWDRIFCGRVRKSSNISQHSYLLYSQVPIKRVEPNKRVGWLF